LLKKQRSPIALPGSIAVYATSKTGAFLISIFKRHPDKKAPVVLCLMKQVLHNGI
jgi:hypothetical protein